jgi:hypothetical protein
MAASCGCAFRRAQPQASHDRSAGMLRQKARPDVTAKQVYAQGSAHLCSQHAPAERHISRQAEFVPGQASCAHNYATGSMRANRSCAWHALSPDLPAHPGSYLPWFRPRCRTSLRVCLGPAHQGAPGRRAHQPPLQTAAAHGMPPAAARRPLHRPLAPHSSGTAAQPSCHSGDMHTRSARRRRIRAGLHQPPSACSLWRAAARSAMQNAAEQPL